MNWDINPKPVDGKVSGLLDVYETTLILSLKSVDSLYFEFKKKEKKKQVLASI